MRAIDFLVAIGRIPPQAWDAIIPKWSGGHSRFDAVSLNPQPLPPVEMFLISAAQMAHDVARVAVEAQAGGNTSAEFLSELIDDWCGTPWPRKWPWPWPGPRPGEGPLPDPWLINTARITGAVVFASYGARLGKGELSEVLLSGADRLAEVATSEQWQTG